MKLDFKLGTLFNRAVGLLFLGLGLWVVIDPEVFTDIYAITATTSDARSTLRAVVGGTEVVLAIVFLLPWLFRFSEAHLHRLGLAIFGGIVCVRFGHIILDAPMSDRMLRETLVELFVASIFIVFVWMKR